jgi:hypothetical protein
MPMLVTLSDVKARLRVWHDDDDAILTSYAEAASEAIIAYLKTGADTFYDAITDTVTGDVPARVETATVMLIGYLYRSPDADPDEAFGQGQLPWPVTAIIYQMRDPALA